MSEQTTNNQHDKDQFARRLHQSLEANRHKKSQHGLMYNLIMVGVGIALIAVMIYFLVTI